MRSLAKHISNLREKLLALTQNFMVLNLTDEMRNLAKLYVEEGVVPSRYFADALHVAAAVFGNAGYLG